MVQKDFLSVMMNSKAHKLHHHTKKMLGVTHPVGVVEIKIDLKVKKFVFSFWLYY